VGCEVGAADLRDEVTFAHDADEAGGGSSGVPFGLPKPNAASLATPASRPQVIASLEGVADQD